ncbi:TerB family tellurite resistance protein [Flavobacterium sediminilitoris]|uniref:TerB family tellurite resistance protein n=1 Tax=Flavobacterium sediminilitoris TaxID=2024526 RepID=A0ABY4HN40_9FLAO|nr:MULTISPECIES: TerB family tellurite resistance protein [Flavobacterium]UOX33691.1 TerB family tellurite resistance protein [Flavobacterium sediminilitoris]
MKQICSGCQKELGFLNTPNFGGGKLLDGGRVCRNCFKVMTKHDISFSLKSKIKYSSQNVYNIINKTKIEIQNVVDRPLPNKLKVETVLPFEDSFENYEKAEENEIINLNALVIIGYIDLKKNFSKRRITIKKIIKNSNDFLINSFCHERNSIRSFKLSRITELVDLETGEIFENPIKFIQDRINETPVGSIVKFFQEYIHEINLMVYMGRVDGYLHENERIKICNFLILKSNNTLDLDILDSEIRRMNSDSSQFRESLNEVSKMENKKVEVFSILKEIAYSDNNLDSMEEGILNLVKKEFQI